MKRIGISMLMLVIIGSIVPAHGQVYSIVRSSFPDGYALSTSGNRFALSSVGEAFVGRAESPTLFLESGFLAHHGSWNILVSVTEMQEPPRIYSLSQNYPNPFNPSTNIIYQIPNASHVMLKVYSLLGQEVATLVNEVQDAGYKSVVWNAGSVASGVYFYRLQTAGFTQTHKMLLTR